MTCFLPPDKGTVQKVIVLPSNKSLHEDLILEELQVFKVSVFSPLFTVSTFIGFSLPKSEGEREGGGLRGHDTKGKRAGRECRVTFGRWMLLLQCSMMGNRLT